MKIKNTIVHFIMYFINVPMMHLILMLFLLLPLLAVFRMKTLDQGYVFSQNRFHVKQTLEKNKKLKADQAELQSMAQLQKWAEKFNFKLPSENQIILIPK